MSSRGLFAVLFTFLFLVFVVVTMLGSLSNRITDEAALARFQEVSQTSNVIIVRRSNSTYLVGHPHDVIYELRVNGKPVSGRCSSGPFSPMICRLYELDQD